jgi:hypothetical protein
VCNKCKLDNWTFFYGERVNGARYVNNILSPFFTELTEEESLQIVFQQDSAAAHSKHATLEALWEVSSDRIISHGLWLPCSPDFTLCDFYLWESLKDNFF